MSLLQWVKRGLGLGPKRTSETTQQKLGTSNTCEVGPEALPMLHEDGYAELVSAKRARVVKSLLCRLQGLAL